jgi:hypothetical protein
MESVLKGRGRSGLLCWHRLADGRPARSGGLDLGSLTTLSRDERHVPTLKHTVSYDKANYLARTALADTGRQLIHRTGSVGANIRAYCRFVQRHRRAARRVRTVVSADHRLTMAMSMNRSRPQAMPTAMTARWLGRSPSDSPATFSIHLLIVRPLVRVQSGEQSISRPANYPLAKGEAVLESLIKSLSRSLALIS